MKLKEIVSRRLNSMRRIFVVMICFGLLMGLAFPFIVEPFVDWRPGRKIYFQLACLAAGFIVGTLCYYLIQITLFRQNKQLSERKAELEGAKNRFSGLVHDAVFSQDWEVSLNDAHVPTCWESKGCEEVGCPAYGEPHVRCWLLAGTYCRGEVQGKFAQKLGDCLDCDVYRASVEQGPINEIAEDFNSLMWAVHEREEMLGEATEKLQAQYGELELLHRQAREMAKTDALTGLRNHGHFQQHLHKVTDRLLDEGQPVSLIMIDLDNFKSVNDRFGHQKGDAFLEQMGALLREESQQGDYAARYGGEEFVIVMPARSGQEAVRAAEGLRKKVKTIADAIDLPPSYVAASFGVADAPACAVDAGSLVAAADSALLFAKRKGRNRVAYFMDLSETELREGDLERLHSRLEGASLQTIRALAEAVDDSDQYQGMDRQRTSAVVSSMARSLGMGAEESGALELAAQLHDIGKIGIPGSVLRKKEKLSAEELSMIHRHPEIGGQILEEARQLQNLIQAILYHHERWDGKGYPEGLKGDDIPQMARIVSILDAYRAMMSDRPYRKALTEHEALAELRTGAGSQFDPRLVEVFIDAIGEGRSGELQAAS